MSKDLSRYVQVNEFGIVQIPETETYQDLETKDKVLADNEIKAINERIEVANKLKFPTRFVSDGYHTFDELYEFRKMYNAVLFNEWAAQGAYGVHKSWKHYEGENCFGGGWFIVVAMLPTGQVSNHYKAADWDLFKVMETEKALYPFDGHTPKDVLIRLKDLCK